MFRKVYGISQNYFLGMTTLVEISTVLLIKLDIGNSDLGFLMSSHESDADTSGDMFL